MKEPEQQKMRMVAFDFDFIQRVANYLSTKPYIEVFEFLNQIQRTAQGSLALQDQEKNEKPLEKT